MSRSSIACVMTVKSSNIFATRKTSKSTFQIFYSGLKLCFPSPAGTQYLSYVKT